MQVKYRNVVKNEKNGAELAKRAGARQEMRQEIRINDPAVHTLWMNDF